MNSHWENEANEAQP
uniref:Uncharacterized protein n=1 Tax=Anguilla anguilla TaxID=7936 RepID=A0A0E9WHA3_ANGAN